MKIVQLFYFKPFLLKYVYFFGLITAGIPGIIHVLLLYPNFEILIAGSGSILQF